MTNFHGTNKKHSFFEGWYLKHQTEHTSIALIPAYHVDKLGTPSASIQIVTAEKSACVDFGAENFHASKRSFDVSIGTREENKFSLSGIKLDLGGDIPARGELFYTHISPMERDIMGPFRFLPNMSCSHGVLSLAHNLYGSLEIGGKVHDFTGGAGYIEKDFGSSFPKDYLWTQCSSNGTCVMLSIADVPIGITHFRGCICAIYHKGQQLRFGTYRGVKIKKYSETQAEIQQGGYTLRATLLRENARELNAPSLGSMERKIRESLACTVRYELYKDKASVFDFTSNAASFEVG